MKSFLLFFIVTFITSTGLYAQDMMPPPPVDNSIYDAFVGDWEGEHEMMGMMMIDNMKCYWDLNHQFLFMEYKSETKESREIKYSALGIYGVDNDGNAVLWWFDDWGTVSVMQGSGTFGENKFTTYGKTDNYTDERTYDFKEGNIIMDWKGTFTSPDGKEMVMEGKTVFKKK